MSLNDLAKKNIIFLGLGVENYALILWLRQQGFTEKITIWNALAKEESGPRYERLKNDKHITWSFGKKMPNLKNYTLIVRSPGVLLDSKLRKELTKKKTLSSATQLFFDFSPTNNIIGVTGTKGKGTTSSLIYEILKAGKKQVWLGGNIGIAPFSFMAKIKKTDWVILELSSFQLQEVSSSPKIAVLTNLSPEHLSSGDIYNPNYHHSFNDYLKSKLNIIKYQKKTDLFVVNEKLRTKLKSVKIASRAIYFSSSQLPTSLVGEHNKENIVAAEIAAKSAGISKHIIAQAVKKFKGLPYRLEFILEKNGVSYYNDSFATTPTATETALKSFAQPIILMAGGSDKGSDFTQLAKLISKKVKMVILLDGKATPRLKQSLIKAGFPIKNMAKATSMKQAMNLAKKNSRPGDIILLSPACASFGMFKNYKDRGEQFKKAILL